MSSPKETKKIKLSQKKLDILKKHAQKQKTKPNVTADEKETKKIKLSPEKFDILKKHKQKKAVEKQKNQISTTRFQILLDRQ